MAGNWINKAINHPGSLTRAAKKKHHSTMEEALIESKSKDKRIRARGQLALRLMRHKL